MSRCVGCGIKIQSNNVNEPGYVPEVIVIENGDNVYCKRCHDIIHHNQQYEVDNDLTRYYQKICNIKNTKSLIILIIDILDLYNGFIPDMDKYVWKNEVMVLINKIDLLPKSLKIHHLENKVKELAKMQKLNIVKVMMISAKKELDVRHVVKKISELKYHPRYKNKTFFDDCYVMGCASVGKSTFINNVCKYFMETYNVITTSDQFHTTVDLIKIPLDNHSFIVDTPGIINYNSLGAYLKYDSMKKLIPNTYIKPRTFQLREQQTIFIGGLCQIDIVKGENVSISFYISNDIYLHRTKTINSTKMFDDKLKQPIPYLVPPYHEEEVKNISDLETKLFCLSDDNEAKDLIISGLGIIHVKGNDLQMKVTIDKKISVVWDELL